MYNTRPITTLSLWTDKPIAKAGVLTSVSITLLEAAWNGVFTLHYIMTGTGNVTITYTVCSTSDGTFLTPGAASAIGTALAAGSDVKSFSPLLAPYMKIVVTENNANPITGLTVWLNFQ
jgi:hypothetical protein